LVFFAGCIWSRNTRRQKPRAGLAFCRLAYRRRYPGTTRTSNERKTLERVNVVEAVVAGRFSSDVHIKAALLTVSSPSACLPGRITVLLVVLGKASLH